MKRIVTKKSVLSIGFVLLLSLIFCFVSCKNGLNFPKEQKSTEKAKVSFSIDGINLLGENIAERMVQFDPHVDTLLYKLDCTNTETKEVVSFKLTEMFSFRSDFIGKYITLDLGTWDFELSAYQFVVDESNMAIVYSSSSSASSQSLTQEQLSEYLKSYYTEQNKLFVAEVSDFTLDDPRISYSVNFEMQAVEVSDDLSGDFNYYIVSSIPENITLTRAIDFTAKYTSLSAFLKGEPEWTVIPTDSITDVTEEFIQLGYFNVIIPDPGIKPIDPKDPNNPIYYNYQELNGYNNSNSFNSVVYKITGSLPSGKHYFSFTFEQTVFDDDGKTKLGNVATNGGEILEIKPSITISNFNDPKGIILNTLNRISFDLCADDASFGEDFDSRELPKTYNEFCLLRLPVPIRSGYDFLGWTTTPADPETSTAVSEEDEITPEIEIGPYKIFAGEDFYEKGDITLYACWKKEDKLTFYYHEYTIDDEPQFNYSCSRKLTVLDPDYDSTKPLQAGDVVVVKLTGTSSVDLSGFVCQIADFEGNEWTNEIGDFSKDYEYPVKADKPFTQFFIVNIQEDSKSVEDCGITLSWFPEEKAEFDSFTLEDASVSFRVYGENESLSLYRDDGFMFNRLEPIIFEDITDSMPDVPGTIYGALFKLTDTDLIAYLTSDIQEDDVYTIDITGVSDTNMNYLCGQLFNIESETPLTLTELLATADESNIVGYSILSDTITEEDEQGNQIQSEKDSPIVANKEITSHFDFSLTQSLENFNNTYLLMFYTPQASTIPATIKNLAAATLYAPEKQFIERKETEHMVMESCDDGVQITITRKSDDLIWKDNIDITEQESGTMYRIPEQVFANTDTVTFIYPFCIPGKTYKFLLGYNNTKAEGEELEPYHTEEGRITAGGGKGELDYTAVNKVKISLSEDDLGRYYNIENFTKTLHQSMYEEMDLEINAVAYEISFCSGKHDWSDTSWVYGQTDYIENVESELVADNNFYKAIVKDGTVNLLDERLGLWKSPVQMNKELSARETYWADFGYRIEVGDYDYNYVFKDKSGKEVTYKGAFYIKKLKTEETAYTPMVFAEGMTITVELPKFENGSISISQKNTEEGIEFACDAEGLSKDVVIDSYNWVLSSADDEKSLSTDEICLITDEIKSDFKNGIYALSLVVFDEDGNMYAATAYITVSNADGTPVENIPEESNVEVTFPEYSNGELGIKKTESSTGITFTADDNGLELVSYSWSLSTADSDEVVSSTDSYTFEKSYSSTLDNGVYALSLVAFDADGNMYAATAYVKVSNEGGNPIQDKQGGNGVNITFPNYGIGNLQIKQSSLQNGGILFTIDDADGKFADYDFCVWTLDSGDKEEVVSETTSFELTSDKIEGMNLEEQSYSLTVFIKTNNGIYADATLYISK